MFSGKENSLAGPEASLQEAGIPGQEGSVQEAGIPGLEGSVQEAVSPAQESGVREAGDPEGTVHEIRHPDRIKKIVKYSSVLGIIACIIVMVLAWKGGYLTSQEKLQNLVRDAGVFGIVLFFLIQIIQVIIPIIPGGVSCLVGVVLYGPIGGFLVNYTGICIGSMFAFAIARHYGRPILYSLFYEKTINKYDSWSEERQRFAKLFAIAIFFPVAPDDFLCYLAGTTKMKWKTYNKIIWLGKPFSIALYSLGLVFVFSHLKNWLMGLAG